MEGFHKLIHQTMPLWTGIFLFSVLVGIVYTAQLLGLTLFNDAFLDPITTRSLHITLMLYGPFMLALSLLAFYDFPYELNFLLASSGIFYIISIFAKEKFIPRWHIFWAVPLTAYALLYLLSRKRA